MGIKTKYTKMNVLQNNKITIFNLKEKLEKLLNFNHGLIKKLIQNKDELNEVELMVSFKILEKNFDTIEGLKEMVTKAKKQHLDDKLNSNINQSDYKEKQSSFEPDRNYEEIDRNEEDQEIENSNKDNLDKEDDDFDDTNCNLRKRLLKIKKELKLDSVETESQTEANIISKYSIEYNKKSNSNECKKIFFSKEEKSILEKHEKKIEKEL